MRYQTSFDVPPNASEELIQACTHSAVAYVCSYLGDTIKPIPIINKEGETAYAVDVYIVDGEKFNAAYKTISDLFSHDPNLQRAVLTLLNKMNS